MWLLVHCVLELPGRGFKIIANLFWLLVDLLQALKTGFLLGYYHILRFLKGTLWRLVNGKKCYSHYIYCTGMPTFLTIYFILNVSFL